MTDFILNSVSNISKELSMETKHKFDLFEAEEKMENFLFLFPFCIFPLFSY